jgi:ribosomal protein S18 acetylase RimI-like enzyme
MDVAERIALGVVDAERLRRERVVGAEVLELDGYVLALSNQPDPALNGVLVEREPEDPEGSLRRAEAECGRRRQSLGVNLQRRRHPRVDDAVRSLGLALLEERPAMAMDPSVLPEAPRPPDVEIRPVISDADVGAFVAVGVAAFDDDPVVGLAFYGAGARGVDGARTFVAWEGEDPVGISAGYFVRGAVSVMGVGVVPEARRRGIGAALTVHAAKSFPDADLACCIPRRWRARCTRASGSRRSRTGRSGFARERSCRTSVSRTLDGWGTFRGSCGHTSRSWWGSSRPPWRCSTPR